CDRVGWKDPPLGCRSSPAEAEGSPAWEAPGRGGAALTTTGRVGTARRPGSGKQGRTVQRRVNQWWNPRKRQSRLEPGGCGPVSSARRAPNSRMAPGDSDRPGLCDQGGHGEGLRRTRGEAAGEKLGTTPADRHTVNVGSVRMPPFPPCGQHGGGQARRRLGAAGGGGGEGGRGARGSVWGGGGGGGGAGEPRPGRRGPFRGRGRRRGYWESRP